MTATMIDNRSRIPRNALDDETDLVTPAANLCRGLYLLGDQAEMEKAGAAATFAGPPQSVALIEAGATALSKWWAAGLGGVIIATWSSVFGWYAGQPQPLKIVILWAAGIITAALVLAIAYILGSDIRSRARAAVATIEARSRIAEAFIRAAQDVDQQNQAATQPAEISGTDIHATNGHGKIHAIAGVFTD